MLSSRHRHRRMHNTGWGTRPTFWPPSMSFSVAARESGSWQLTSPAARGRCGGSVCVCVCAPGSMFHGKSCVPVAANAAVTHPSSLPPSHSTLLCLQVAVSLSRDFQQVVAQDSSAAQIQHAEQQPNIHYEQAPAEATGLPDGCADLVTAAQSMHWCAGILGGLLGGAHRKRAVQASHLSHLSQLALCAELHLPQLGIPAATQRWPPCTPHSSPCPRLSTRPCTLCCCRLDAPAFFRECRRILKLSGALAVFSYIPLEIRFDGNAAASEVLKAALLESNPFFHPHRQRFVLHLFEGAGGWRAGGWMDG